MVDGADVIKRVLMWWMLDNMLMLMSYFGDNVESDVWF